MALLLNTLDHYASLLNKYDTWMFDCDGVLWRGDVLIDGVICVLALLRKHKKKIVFVTNNASQSRKTLKSKFDKLGVQADVDEIYGSAYAAAVYISSVIQLPKDQKAYVIGMRGLEEELAEEGISYAGGTDPQDCQVTAKFSTDSLQPDPAISTVVCGLDFAISYTKIAKAFYYLSSPLHPFHGNMHWVLTNEDRTYPSEKGQLPGAGAISAPLRLMLSGKMEPISVGKPSQDMLECIRAKVDFDPTRTIMIGDRLDTDILFGKNGGLATLLVLSGISTKADVSRLDAASSIPDYVTNSIGDFRVLLEEKS